MQNCMQFVKQFVLKSVYTVLGVLETGSQQKYPWKQPWCLSDHVHTYFVVHPELALTRRARLLQHHSNVHVCLKDVNHLNRKFNIIIYAVINRKEPSAPLVMPYSTVTEFSLRSVRVALHHSDCKQLTLTKPQECFGQLFGTTPVKPSILGRAYCKCCAHES